jgi:hypothetical protein
VVNVDAEPEHAGRVHGRACARNPGADDVDVSSVRA